jgi:putative transposase
VGDKIQAKNLETWHTGLFGYETSGGKEILPDWEYIAIGVAEDHVHLHMVIPPKYAVSTVVETLKKNTNRQLNQKFRFLKQVYWDNEGIWSKGLFVATVGINETIIRKYDQQQKKEDTGQAELEF